MGSHEGLEAAGLGAEPSALSQKMLTWELPAPLQGRLLVTLSSLGGVSATPRKGLLAQSRCLPVTTSSKASQTPELGAAF